MVLCERSIAGSSSSQVVLAVLVFFADGARAILREPIGEDLPATIAFDREG